MKVQPILQIIMCVLLCAALALVSCQKKPHGTFIVSGQLWDSCNGSPAAGRSLKIAGISYGFNSKTHHDFGSGTTDNNGNFSITCDYYSGSEISLYEGSELRIQNLARDYSTNRDYNLGRIYERIFTGINIHATFSGNLMQGDSFFIGLPLHQPQAFRIDTAGNEIPLVELSEGAQWIYNWAPYKSAAIYSFTRTAYDSLNNEISANGWNPALFPHIAYDNQALCALDDTAVTFVKP